MDSGGLDQVLPARGPAPANVAQRYAQGGPGARGAPEPQMEEAYDRYETVPYDAQRRSQNQRRTSEAVREAAAEWGGMSLGDALVPPKRTEKPVGSPSNNDYNERRSGGTGPGDYDRRDSNDYGRGGNEYNRGSEYNRQPGGDYDRGAPAGEQFDDRFDNRPPSKASADRPPFQENDEGFRGGGNDRMGYDDDNQDFNRQAQAPPQSSPGGRPGVAWTPMQQQDDRPSSAFRDEERDRAPRSRQSAPPASADDGWGGESLADAFAPKKAAPTGGGSSGSAPPRRGDSSAASGAQECKKKPEEIIAWVRSLPESHVPEKARENIAAIIEESRLSGEAFTSYVQRVPPEICAPKHAMKLKAAWNNVLAEAAVAEVARQNANSKPCQKAVAIVC